MAERDEVAQMIYDDLNKQGIFKNDEVAQMIGHDLRGSGLVLDPTQGGLVNPTPPPSAAPTPTSYTRQPGAPPVLPAVTASTPYMQAPAPKSPPVPRPSPVNVTRPAAVPVQPQPQAQPQVPAQPLNFLTDVQPTGKSRIKPLGFIKSPLETTIKGQNAALDQISRQFGPGHHYAEGGPVDVQKRQAAETTAQLGGAELPALWDDWTHRARLLRQNEDTVIKQVKLWQQGKLSDQQAAQLRQDWHDLEMNRQVLMDRAKRLNDYKGMANATARQYAGQPIHTGPYLPQEDAGRGGSGLWDIAKGTVAGTAGSIANPILNAINSTGAGRWLTRNIAGLKPGAIDAFAKALPQARNELMAEGKYPALPPNPGRNALEQRGLDQQTVDLRRMFFMDVPGLGLMTRPDVGDTRWRTAVHQMPLTPWQQKLVPIFEQQVAAEREAQQRAKTGQALAWDAATFGLAELGGAAVGKPVAKFLGRFAEPLESRLMASNAPILVKSAAKLGIRAGVQAVSHGAGAVATGAVAGPAQTGVESLQQVAAGGKPLPASAYVQSAVQGAKTFGGIGAVLGAGGALLHPHATINAPAADVYHTGPKLKPDVVNLPGGAKIDLNTATRAELETASNNLPAIHPAARKIREKLWGKSPDVAIEAGMEPGGALAPKEPTPAGSATIHTAAGAVPARSLSADDINNVLQDYATQETQAPLTPEQAHGKAQAVKQAELHQQYAEDRSVPIRPESGQAYQDAWTSEKSGGKTHYDLLNNAADQVRETSPELAGKLDRAKETLRQDFQRDFRQRDLVQNGVLEKPSSYPTPPEQSVWRGLTEDERNVLLEPVKKVLLTQDLTNSLQVLSPDTPVRELMKGVDTRSSKALERIADQRAGEAEQAFGAKRGVSAPEPVSAPGETPAAGETVPASNTHQIEATPEAVAPQAQAGEVVPPTNQTETATPPAEVPGERRVNVAQRKAVGEMSPEEMKTALLADDMTGLGNKRAWEEAPKEKHIASVDADSLKWVNDNYGHPAGDGLLSAVGDALKRAGLGEHFYHISGDEFYGHGADPADLAKRIEAANEWLGEHEITFKDKDGVERTVKGLGISYGIGEDLHAAEGRLGEAKVSREAGGQRAGRGERPPRLAESTQGPGETAGRPGATRPAGEGAARERVGGHQEEARPVEKGASNGTDANGRPVIQPKGTPGKEMSDFQAFGTNFPAEWDLQDLQEQQAKPRLPDDVLQQRQELQRQQENEARRQQGLPPREQLLRQMAQQQHGTAMDAAELQRRQEEQKRQMAQAQGVTEASPPEGVSPDVIAKLFPDPETRNLFLHDKGDPARVVGFREEARQKWQALIATKDQFINGWKRVFPDLARTAAHSELEQLLLRRMDADAIANFKTQNSIRQALHGLSKTEQFAFNALAYNKDMIREIARQRERFLKEGGDEADFKPLLRDGWTEETALATQKAIADTLANDKSIDAQKVADAYQKVIDYRKPIVDKFVKLYEKVNGRKLGIDPEDYFRHNMLLAEAGGYGKGGVAGVHGRPGRSHLKGRVGSDIAYNSDFVEAEMSWLPDMVKDTMDLQILSHVQDNYDISEVVKAAKAEVNDPGLLDYLQEHASGMKPTNDMLPAMGKLAAAGHLPDRMDGRFSTLIHSLHHVFEANMELKRLGKPEIGLSPEMEKELPTYAKWLVKEKGENVSIRSIADDPNWLKRNGYSEFQAIEGRHFFKVMGVPERLMKDAQGQILQSLDIDPNDLRTVMAMGQERRTMVVPEDVAKTLDRFAARPEENYHNWLAKGMRTIQQWWKLDKLYNPVHSSIYWIGNALSDADAIMRGNPKAFRYVMGAGKELFNVLVRGKDPGETLKTWIERGGIASSFVAREAVGRGNGVDMLRDFAARQRPFYQVLAGGVQQAFTLPHELREATGRYATYLAYLDDLKKTGQPRNYGASNPALVDGLSDIHDKAWKLSNDLIGPYNEVNATGQFLRRNVFPFWSWQAVSAGREKMLLKNAWDAPAIAERMGKKISGGTAVGVRAIALGRYAAGAASVGLTLEAWNRLNFGPNYRDKLPKDMRDRIVPVLCLRYDPQSDTMLYMDRPGNLVDVTNWLNLNKGYGYYQDYMNRKMTLPEIAEDMFATGAKNRLWQQTGFHLKFGTDVVLGYKTFPDVNNPRPARDKAQQFFDTFSLGKAYASIKGYPTPPPTKVSVFGKEVGGRAPWWVPFVGGSDVVHTLTSTNVVNIGESNYFDMIGQARDWAQQQKGGGEVGGGFPNDNKSQAIYYFKLSQRYGDKDSAEKFLWDAARFGETDEGVKGTLKSLDPLQGLSESQRARYMEQLSPDDSERLRRAYQHWAQLVAPGVDAAPLVKLPIKDMVRQLRAQVDGALNQEWSSHIASGQTSDPLITKIRQMPEADRQAYLSSQNAAGEQRIRDRYGVLQQRAAPNLNKNTVAAFNKLPLPEYVKQMDQAIMQYRQMKMQQDVQEKAHR